MLSERQLEELLKVFQQRAQAVTNEYLKRMGEHLKAIGGLKPSDVHRLIELKRMNANIEEVKRELARIAAVMIEDVETVFRDVAASDERFAREIFATNHTPTVKYSPIAGISSPVERILKAQLRITQQEMANLSQTTIESALYRKAIDVAVQTVQTGLTDYTSAIRSAMKEAAAEGLRVKYPSGYARRLDTAVRQNVLDGLRSLNQDVMDQVGKEYGADGVEITAHALCAEDHLPYQGRQYSHKEFDRIQNTLRRPFGMWNCKHTMFPILLGVSQPAYTEAELQAYARNSREEVTIDGVTMSRYEWTQKQRQIETAVRAQKNIANAAKASGDSIARREAQRNINRLTAEYGKISEAAGLIEKKEHMTVAGFRKVKTAEELKKPEKRGIINMKISVDGSVVNPMDAAVYQRMRNGLLKNGITVIEARGDDLRYLLKGIGAEATYSHGYIMHAGAIPSASAFFEEIIHATQARRYGEMEEYDSIELSAREVAANRMLLKNGRAYGFDKTDFSDIEGNLSYWEKRYKKETGYDYDEGKHNRSI